jgi:Zn-dependent peptidase ImmA (M78 family)/DNA-binding XRE family transcriptional regulator
VPAVNPEILIWVRQISGFSLDQAAAELDIKPDALLRLEEGLKEPSYSLLKKMAQVYNRSLITFYLDKPPSEDSASQDFRTLPNSTDPILDGKVKALIRNILSRQILVKNVLEEENSSDIEFINSIDIQNPVIETAESIKKTLNFDINEFRNINNINSAIKYVREKIEDVGVFVLLMSDLGSYHSSIPVSLFRGFAISDNLAPFIIVNNQDSKHAQIFTMFHELVHLWIGETGISAGEIANKIEVYCNDVAAEILLPIKEVVNLNLEEDTYESIKKISRSLNLSKKMLVYRLFKAKRISLNMYKQLNEIIEQEYIEQREQDKSNKKDGGPNYYKVQANKLGKNLLLLVSRSVNEGVLSYTKAGKILGVKPHSLNKLLDEAR